MKTRVNSWFGAWTQGRHIEAPGLETNGCIGKTETHAQYAASLNGRLGTLSVPLSAMKADAIEVEAEFIPSDE